MKRISFLGVLMIAIAVLTLGAASALAQRGMGQGAGRMYDTATETTVKGTVEEVKQVSGPRGGPGGTHLILKTDKETLEVHLGPTTFLEKEKFTFAKGDQIEVTGSKVKIGAADALLAREVKKGDKTLTLRNAQGIPAWSSGRRG
jgi:DNA/RNA endonuclease YhcR with UshA esterase domain